MKRLLTSADLVQEFLEKEASRRSMLKGAALLVGGSIVGCGPERADGGQGQGQGGGPGSGPGPDPGQGSDGEGGGGGKADHASEGEGEGEGEGEPGTEGEGEGEGEGEVIVDDGLQVVGMGWSDEDYLAALDAALDETLGLSFIQPGQTVYFKVNSNNFDRYPHSTNPELIVELARRCKDLGADRVIVGDRSFWGDGDTVGNMRLNGITRAASDAGAELIVFEDHTVDWVQIPQENAPTWVGGFRLPLPVVQADHIINLPLVKTHFIAGFTMALKNVLGLPHPTDRAREGNLKWHVPERVPSQIAECNVAITPSLNILDGYRAVITGGPNASGSPRATYADPKVIIASTDRIATDVAGIAVLQTLSPRSEAVTRQGAWDHPQIVAAVEYGLGVSGPDEMKLVGPTVPDLARYQELAG